MARTAVAAEDPDKPDQPMSATRPRLGIVPESPDPANLDDQRFRQKVFTAADIDRLPAAARHRIAAYIHLQIAALEEMGEVPGIP